MQQSFKQLNIIVSLGLLAGILLSFKAWLPEGFQGRVVPNIPFPCAESFSSASDISWLAILLLAHCTDIFLVVFNEQHWSKITKGIILVAIAMLVLHDQVRMQPWIFLYALFYLAVVAFPSKKEVLKMTRYILASMYLWAGVHKLNPAFIDNITLSIFKVYDIPIACKDWGYIIPVFEMILSFILLLQHTKRTGAYLAILMHAGIIMHYCIFLQYNLIILPWNICCAAMVWFSARGDHGYSPTTVWHHCKQGVLVIIAGVLPVLNFYGGYPAYLSWSLYTGKDKIIMTCINKNNILASLQQSITSYGSPGYEIINVTH